MAFLELKLFSEVLGIETAVNVILPQRSTNGQIGSENGAVGGTYKCLYLLHGLSNDHTSWCRRTSIERYAGKHGICVVMPCADTSFYTDMKYGKKYYTYIAEELPKLICQFFHVSDKREDTFVAGLSMGGYGALKIGLRECDRFSKVAGLSASTDMDVVAQRVGAGIVPVFGEDLVIPPEDDLYCLAEMKKDDPNRPKIFMCIGTEDFLYEMNQNYRKKLESLNYDLTYHEAPGIHDWKFWDEYIQRALEWMLA